MVYAMSFNYKTPVNCPYTLTLLRQGATSSLFTIKEVDKYGEFPNIYVKCHYSKLSKEINLILLSDTGTGRDTCDDVNGAKAKEQDTADNYRWNIETFLEATLNPNHTAPYIVLLSHCHYDHICGLRSLLSTRTNVTVLSSSNDPEFITPWGHLQKNSMCARLGLIAPHYSPQLISNGHYINYKSRGNLMSLTVQVFHTPGHTPDSLAWYDHEFHILNVGDMFYERTKALQEDLEPSMPVFFVSDSDVVQWSASMHTMLEFVRRQNAILSTQSGERGTLNVAEHVDGDWTVINAINEYPRVTLCAAHVTIEADAELAILDMLSFMLRIQFDQVPRKLIKGEGYKAVWLWDDSLSSVQIETHASKCRYSVQAPWHIIHKQPPTAQCDNKQIATPCT